MHRAWLLVYVLALRIILSTSSALADGMVVQEVYQPKVEIPNQQALIHFSDNVEQLIIETSFLGKGTNFAWVVPLPSPPKVEPVSDGFFQNLQHAFQPQFIPKVAHYYVSVLFLCGLAFLGWRALKDEVPWTSDLPLCLLISGGAWLACHHFIFGILALLTAVYIRIFTRSPAAFAAVMLFGVGLAGAMVIDGLARPIELFGSIGSDGSPAAGGSDARVISVQHAGVFDSTTIKGTSSADVIKWLGDNGYNTAEFAEPAISKYVKDGWVFVASKVGRDNPDAGQTALHPLAFTFSTPKAIYPMRLTAVNEDVCAIDLYVLSTERATARHFDVARCDKIAMHLTDPKQSLRLDAEARCYAGNATVATKLSGKLKPKQMQSDVVIKSSRFLPTGRYIFSYSGAFVIALNIAIPLAALSWFAAGGIHDGWTVNSKLIWAVRRKLLAISVVASIIVFCWLPKTEIAWPF